MAECAWTGMPLQKGFDVDHIIPYTLWHNNDLWNLIPASRAANSAKRDKLPTREILVARRGRILDYWDLMRADLPERFDYEASRIAGVRTLPRDWHGLVFRCVADAVEFTAVQRGCERWQPT